MRARRPGLGPNLAALICMACLLGVFATVWMPFLPVAASALTPGAPPRVDVDYALWLPDLLAGYFWYLRNGFLALPWFSPSQCAGIPFHADPQVAFLSIPQFLSFIMPPLQAVRLTVLAFAAAGFGCTWLLARRVFALDVAPALLAAGLFMLNGFYGARMAAGHLTYAPFMLLPGLAAAALPWRPARTGPLFYPAGEGPPSEPAGEGPPSHPAGEGPPSQPAGEGRLFQAASAGALSHPAGHTAPDPRPLRRQVIAVEILRAGMIGLIAGLSVHAGMVHALPPLGLSVLTVVLMHALLLGWRWAALVRLSAGAAIGLALSAGKLAASLALLSQFPRAIYPLPGFPNLANLLAAVLRSLFLTVDDRMGQLMTNFRIIQEQQEFEYGVSPAPLLLMLAGLAWWFWQRRQRSAGAPVLRPKLRPELRPEPRARPIVAVALTLLLLLPVALNAYTPAWNGFLKALPFFASSSTNLRWLSALILPAILGGALALHYTPPLARHGRVFAAAGLAIACATLALADRSKYGPHGMAIYDPTDIGRAWHAAHDSGRPPPITAVYALLDADNQPVMLPERQNAMAQGISNLYCYEPIFGYRLESFPQRGLRGGRVLDEVDGRLNLKNPACYVFPDANLCRPGDQFSAADAGSAATFAAYGRLDFAKPAYAHAADWISLLAACALPPILLAATLVALRRAPPRRAT